LSEQSVSSDEEHSADHDKDSGERHPLHAPKLSRHRGEQAAEDQQKYEERADLRTENRRPILDEVSSA
jgi:hypothetical protein